MCLYQATTGAERKFRRVGASGDGWVRDAGAARARAGGNEILGCRAVWERDFRERAAGELLQMHSEGEISGHLLQLPEAEMGLEKGEGLQAQAGVEALGVVLGEQGHHAVGRI